MKLLHDLAICDMIHIGVLVEKSYSCCNWLRVSAHTRVSNVDGLFFPRRFLLSVKPHIASIMYSRKCPFFLFPLEEDGSTGHFSACLLLWASLSVASSSTSSTPSVLTLTCTPSDRKAASSSLSSSLLGAGWADEIWNKECCYRVITICACTSYWVLHE